MRAIIATIGEYNISGSDEVARAQTPGALYAQIDYLAKAMKSAGFPASTVLTYSIAQAMHESDWFTSHVFQADNNATGIKFINKPYQQATRGIPAPKSEGGGNYAHFDSVAGWAKDYLRILSLNTGGKGRPIDAATAQQFLDREKANRYFQDPAYYTKFNAALRKVTAALNWGSQQNQQFTDAYSKGQTTFTVDSQKGLTSNSAFNADRFFTVAKMWATDHPVLATAAGGVTLLLLVKALSK